MRKALYICLLADLVIFVTLISWFGIVKGLIVMVLLAAIGAVTGILANKYVK